MSEKMHYFRAIEGHACRRFGSEAFIGCARGPKGFTWNTDVVVAITDNELAPYRKDYNSYLRHGDLKRATKADYDKWIAKRKTAGNKLKDARDKAKKAAAKEAEAAAKEVADKAAAKEVADKAAAKEVADKAAAKEVADKAAATKAAKAATNDDSESEDADQSGTAA